MIQFVSFLISSFLSFPTFLSPFPPQDELMLSPVNWSRGQQTLSSKGQIKSAAGFEGRVVSVGVLTSAVTGQKQLWTIHINK